METISWYITSTQIRLSTSKYAKIRALDCLIFRLRMKVLSVAALYRYINSDHSDEQTTKSAIRKECDHVWVHLFGLTNKSTWPKSLTSGTKINCNAYFWIRGLPVSVVRGSTLPIVLSSTEPFLSVFTQNTLHHSQKLEFFRSFKSDHTTSNYLDLTRGTAEREIGKTTNK